MTGRLEARCPWASSGEPLPAHLPLLFERAISEVRVTMLMAQDKVFCFVAAPQRARHQMF